MKLPIVDADATGKRLKSYRLRDGYTVRDVAEICGVAPVTVYRWEDGFTLPKADSLVTLSALHMVSLEELIVTYI